MSYLTNTESVLVMTFPATGWYARIRLADEEVYDSLLICWAVMDPGEAQEVVGLMATDEVVIADQTEGFMCYIHESEIKEQADARAVRTKQPTFKLDEKRG